MCPKSEVRFYCKNNKLLTSIDINEKLVLNKLQNLKIKFNFLKMSLNSVKFLSLYASLSVYEAFCVII